MQTAGFGAAAMIAVCAFAQGSAGSQPSKSPDRSSEQRDSAQKKNKRPAKKTPKAQGDTIPPPKTNDPMPRVPPKSNDPMPRVEPQPNGPPTVERPDPRKRPVKPLDPTKPTTDKR